MRGLRQAIKRFVTGASLVVIFPAVCSAIHAHEAANRTGNTSQEFEVRDAGIPSGA